MEEAMEINNQTSNPPLEQGTGYLIVRASTAGGAIPLEGARVKIWNDIEMKEDLPLSGGAIRHVLITNRDGNTIRLPLPAPRKELSYTPGKKPYALYHIDISADGYYPQHFINVPIYDTVTSIQNAYLIPLPEGSIYDGNEPLGETIDEGVNPAL
jgi:hypothetical protein